MINYTVGLLESVERELEEWEKEVEDKIRRVSTECLNTIKMMEEEIRVVCDQIKYIESENKLADDVIRENQKNEILFKKQIAENKKKIESLKSEKSSLVSQKSVAEGEQKSQLEKQIKEINDSIEELKQANQELEEKINAIRRNEAKLYEIKSQLKTELDKCNSHLSELKTYKSRLTDSRNYFINNAAPYVMRCIHDQILPSMRNAVQRGRELASAMIDLSGTESNIYYAEICVDSAGWFKGQVSQFRSQFEKVKFQMSRCRNSTKAFAGKIKDKVSLYASKEMDSVTSGIDSTVRNDISTIISKMDTAGTLCQAYESINVN